MAGKHIGEKTNTERNQAKHLADGVDAPDELLQHRRRALRGPGREVVDTVLADAGIVRESESEERQRDGDVEVGGRGVEAELVMLGERQRYESDEVVEQHKEENAAHERKPDLLPALHGGADDALASQLVESLHGKLEPARHAPQAARDNDRQKHYERRGDPQVDDGLVDRQVDRADLGELDDGMERELAGDLKTPLHAARDEKETDHNDQSGGQNKPAAESLTHHDLTWQPWRDWRTGG